MECPGCGHSNREDAKFCLGCGRRFSVACASCGHEVPSDARFCDECGAEIGATRPTPSERSPRDYTPAHLAQKILSLKAAVEGERKQVTVLFADGATRGHRGGGGGDGRVRDHRSRRSP